MPAAKQTEPATYKSLEMNIERNIHELDRAGDEIAANTLATLLRRVCTASTCEIDNLIGELSRDARDRLRSPRASSVACFNCASLAAVALLSPKMPSNASNVPNPSLIPNSTQLHID